MPTGRCSAEAVRRGTAAPGAVRSLGPLLRLRLAGVPGRGRVLLGVGAALLVLLTLSAAVVPALVTLPTDLVDQVRTYLPAAVLGFLVTSTTAVVSAGGGRELIPAEQAVAFPVGTTTDHLASLLLAPVNLAWLVQAWALLAGVAAMTGPERLWAAQLPTLLWIGTATAVAQAVAWLIEVVRLRRGGAWVVRGVTVVLAVALLAVATTGHLLVLATSLGAGSVVELTRHGASGSWGPWAAGVVLLAVLAGAAVAVGAVAARHAARRPPRVQASVESRAYPPRSTLASGLRALIRVDRASVWRSPPLRRGIVMMAVLPVLVGFAGQLEWAVVPVLPGLAASGGALLFGVNAWCLDARGAVWRETLPVSPRVVLLARTWVLGEVVVLAEVGTIVVCGLRAGVPTASELVATIVAATVVALRVVASSMRWSVRPPFGVDLRRVRATPAPPAVMVGYSARLAVMATTTGLLFSVVGQATSWPWPLGLGAVLAVTSLASLRRTVLRWDAPALRAQVVATVSTT